MKIKTELVYPPIPDRRLDWSAIDDDTYDGPGCPIGRGPTEAAAIADLMEQLAAPGPKRHIETAPDHVWTEFEELRRLLFAGDYEAYRKKCIELGIQGDY